MHLGYVPRNRRLNRSRNTGHPGTQGRQASFWGLIVLNMDQRDRRHTSRIDISAPFRNAKPEIQEVKGTACTLFPQDWAVSFVWNPVRAFSSFSLRLVSVNRQSSLFVPIPYHSYSLTSGISIEMTTFSHGSCGLAE